MSTAALNLTYPPCLQSPNGSDAEEGHHGHGAASARHSENNGLPSISKQQHHPQHHQDSDGSLTEDGALPPIGNSLGKNNAARRGTLPPPSYYDGPAYSTKGSKTGAAANVPAKRQPGAPVKYGNKVVQGGGGVGISGTSGSLASQSSLKQYSKTKTLPPSNNTSGAIGAGSGMRQGGGGGGSKYISPYSLRNLAVQEQI